MLVMEEGIRGSGVDFELGIGGIFEWEGRGGWEVNGIGIGICLLWDCKVDF